MKQLTMLMLAVAMLLAAGTTRAQDKDAMPMKGFRADFVNQMKDVEEKLVDLAGAMPAESYSWRPMEGVRSVSEVYMHITLANYMFARIAGHKAEDAPGRDMEKTVTDKDKVVAMLKKSFDAMRDAIGKTTDDELEKEVTMFGGPSSVRNVYFTAATHMHEHMGQSIAYARMNKIVPPWTAAEEAAAAAKEKK